MYLMENTKMREYAYLLDDPNWPPLLYEIRGKDLETDLIIVSPVLNKNKVLYVYEDDIWRVT
jgi:hypothetical protein